METHNPQPALRETFKQFVDAVVHGRDEDAERLSQSLIAADMPALVTLAQDKQTLLAEPVEARLPFDLQSESASDFTKENRLDLRWWSIRGLAVCGDEGVIPELMKALDDSNPEIRAATALALGHIGQRLASEGKALASLDGRVGEQISSQAVLPSMAVLLNDSVGFVRQAAADALVLLESQAIAPLQEVLANAPEGARVRAAYALRKIGTRGSTPMDATPALFQILNDSNYLVHTYAHEALDEMGLLDNVLVVL